MGDPASVAPGVTDAGATLDGHEPDLCFAVTVTRNGTDWTVNSLKSCFSRIDDTIEAVQRLGSENPTFAMLCVDDEYFIIVRPTPSRVHLLLSDATMAVDDNLASSVLDAMGAQTPEMTEEELDRLDPWAEGDLSILADLGLSEQVMSVICDDSELWASEQLLRIAAELGLNLNSPLPQTWTWINMTLPREAGLVRDEDYMRRALELPAARRVTTSRWGPSYSDPTGGNSVTAPIAAKPTKTPPPMPKFWPSKRPSVLMGTGGGSPTAPLLSPSNLVRCAPVRSLVRDWGDSSLGHTNRKQVRVDRLLTLFATPLYCINSKCGAGFSNENVLIS